jgi:hypothetical protein
MATSQQLVDPTATITASTPSLDLHSALSRRIATPLSPEATARAGSLIRSVSICSSATMALGDLQFPSRSTSASGPTFGTTHGQSSAGSRERGIRAHMRGQLEHSQLRSPASAAGIHEFTSQAAGNDVTAIFYGRRHRRRSSGGSHASTLGSPWLAGGPLSGSTGVTDSPPVQPGLRLLRLRRASQPEAARQDGEPLAQQGVDAALRRAHSYTTLQPDGAGPSGSALAMARFSLKPPIGRGGRRSLAKDIMMDHPSSARLDVGLDRRSLVSPALAEAESAALRSPMSAAGSVATRSQLRPRAYAAPGTGVQSSLRRMPSATSWAGTERLFVGMGTGSRQSMMRWSAGSGSDWGGPDATFECVSPRAESRPVLESAT